MSISFNFGCQGARETFEGDNRNHAEDIDLLDSAIQKQSRGLSIQSAQPLKLDKKVTIDSKTILHVYQDCSQNYLSGTQTFTLGTGEYIKGPGTVTIPNGQYLSGGNFDDMTCSIRTRKFKFSTPQNVNASLKRMATSYNNVLQEQKQT